MAKKPIRKKTELTITSIESVGFVTAGANSGAQIVLAKRNTDADIKENKTMKTKEVKKTEAHPAVLKAQAAAEAAERAAAEAAATATDDDAEESPATPDAAETPAPDAAPATTDDDAEESPATPDAAPATPPADPPADPPAPSSDDVEKAAMKAQIEVLTKRLNESDEAALVASSIAKAKEIGTGIAKSDELGAFLKAARSSNLHETQVDYIEGILKTASIRIQKGDLFKVEGDDLIDGELSPEALLEKDATALAKSDKITYAEAVVKLANEDPEKYYSIN